MSKKDHISSLMIGTSLVGVFSPMAYFVTASMGLGLGAGAISAGIATTLFAKDINLKAVMAGAVAGTTALTLVAMNIPHENEHDLAHGLYSENRDGVWDPTKEGRPMDGYEVIAQAPGPEGL